MKSCLTESQSLESTYAFITEYWNMSTEYEKIVTFKYMFLFINECKNLILHLYCLHL